MTILGIFENIINASLTITNLETVGVDGNNISAIMKDEGVVETIAQVSGPYTGGFDEFMEKKLQAMGLSKEEIETDKRALSGGGMLIMVHTDDDNAPQVKEVLTEHQAAFIKAIK